MRNAAHPIVPLSEVALSITDGDHQAPPKADQGIPFLTISAINDGTLKIDKATRYVPESYYRSLKRERIPQVGDILFSVTGSIAIPAIIDDPRPFTFQRHIAIIKPHPEVLDSRYLWYALLTDEIKEQAVAVATGTAQLTIPLGGLRNLKIALPPIQQQRRIVAKLDSLRARSARARNELDHIPKLIEHYKQAILAKLYDEATENADTVAPLGDLALEVRNGLSRKPEPSPPGVPILRISAVRPGRVRLDEPRYYRAADGERLDTYALRNGDLLFTRYNGNPELVAVCGLVRGLIELTVYPDKLIRVRLDNERVLPEFVELIAQAPQARRQLEPHIKTAAGQHGISGRDLQTLTVPVAPLALQSAITKKATAALAWLDKVATEYARAERLLPKLDQAILAKAFRGELVPQDPNDEPAAVLLERIRAERENGEPTRRRQARSA